MFFSCEPFFHAVEDIPKINKYDKDLKDIFKQRIVVKLIFLKLSEDYTGKESLLCL